MTAALTLARREIVRFLRQPSRVVGAIAPPLLMWLLIGSGFRGSFRAPGEAAGGYVAYFYPGTVVLVILFASIFATISVIEDRREGFLQAVLVAPVAPHQIVLGKVLGGAVLGLLQGGVLLLFVPVLGLPWSARDLLFTVGVLALLSLSLTALGFSFAWSLESTQGFHAVMNLFLIPMWLLSGAFFPVHGAPLWMRLVMAINPLTYGVAALRRTLTPEGAAGAPGMGVALALTAGFAVVMLLVATAVVAARPGGPSRRRGRKP